MNTSNLYDRVRADLKTTKLTQRQVAAGSGVPFSTVSKIAQGSTTNPTIKTLQALADFFDRLAVDAPCSQSCPMASVLQRETQAA